MKKNEKKLMLPRASGRYCRLARLVTPLHLSRSPVRNPPAMQETPVPFLVLDDSLEKV